MHIVDNVCFSCVYITVCSADGAVQLHHLSVNDSPVVYLSFSSSGKLLAICTDDKILRLWEMENGWSLKAER